MAASRLAIDRPEVVEAGTNPASIAPAIGQAARQPLSLADAQDTLAQLDVEQARNRQTVDLGMPFSSRLRGIGAPARG